MQHCDEIDAMDHARHHTGRDLRHGPARPARTAGFTRPPAPPAPARLPLPLLAAEDRLDPAGRTAGARQARKQGTPLAALRERERDLIGGFSEPGKMPWLSYSIPAEHCRVGSRLRDVPGSVCQGCYACKGNYIWPNVRDAMERRFRTLADLPAWADAMARLLADRAARFRPTPADPWPAFRWHDSGDLQSAAHLEAICTVAERTRGVRLADGTAADIRYWLPTREYGVVAEVRDRRGGFPLNLCVRLSAPMTDGPVPAGLGLPVSSAHSRPSAYPDALDCPAFARGGGCGDCRACWDPATNHVSYRAH
jgi:hypothetical protein